MKKVLLLTVSLSLISSFALAQLSKGSTLLGGSIGFTKSESKMENRQDYDQNSVSFSPSYGKAIKENQFAGVKLSFGSYKYGYDSSYNKNNSYGAGVFLRRYLPLARNFYLFGEAGAAVNYFKWEQLYAEDRMNATKGGLFYMNLYPGISYAIHKRLLLEIGLDNLVNLSFEHSKTETKENNVKTSQYKTNAVSFASNVSNFSSLSIGARLLFEK